MKKVYLVVGLAFFFVSGSVMAQNVVTNGSSKEGSKNKENVSVEKKAEVTVDPTKPSFKEAVRGNNDVDTKSTAIQTDSDQKVKTVKKEDFKTFSEERRKYMLEHPELYKIEE